MRVRAGLVGQQERAAGAEIGLEASSDAWLNGVNESETTPAVVILM